MPQRLLRNCCGTTIPTSKSPISRAKIPYDDNNKINRIIQEHVNDLNEMAREYQNAENASLEAGSSLISDVVS